MTRNGNNKEDEDEEIRMDEDGLGDRSYARPGFQLINE